VRESSALRWAYWVETSMGSEEEVHSVGAQQAEAHPNSLADYVVDPMKTNQTRSYTTSAQRMTQLFGAHDGLQEKEPT
jgi:hypothetical protein